MAYSPFGLYLCAAIVLFCMTALYLLDAIPDPSRDR